MFCTNCGNKLPDDAVFCPFCGEKVLVEAASAAQLSVAEEPPVVAAAEPLKKKKTGLIAAIIAVVIIAMGVGGYFIYQNHPSTKLAKLRTQIAATIEAKDYKGAIDLIEQAGGSARMLAPSAEVVEYHYPLYSKPDETGKKLGMYNYKSHFTNGLPKVIMTTDPNGKETNVVLISEDGKSWYSMPDVNSPQGIYGFY